ncbi:PIN domain-containing protein [Sphingomonas bacterium]|uniref:PIN domain-containing protein n=1 Tax=Sphingomonas bacterium TaxID=1895847 RepID=UPI00349FF24C
MPLPLDIWRLLATMPMLHRDPVDRMLIAHAIHDNLTLVTADAMIRRYPVRSLW